MLHRTPYTRKTKQLRFAMQAVDEYRYPVPLRFEYRGTVFLGPPTS